MRIAQPGTAENLRHADRIECSEIWGGIGDADRDVRTSALTASLYASAADGGKGGDIYYFSVCESDKITRVAVADVVGHGEAVSRMSQWLYGALAERMNSLDGNGILADMNCAVHERGPKAMTTAVVMGFQVADANLYLSYAGHPPLLIRRRNDGPWRPALLHPQTKPSNLPLGVMKNVRYDQEKIPIGSGDRLFLFTDGLLEAPDAAGRHFGKERLLAALEQASDKALFELKAAVLNEVLEHTGGLLAHDDVTLMAIEVR